jgi:hypothetical protein
MSMAMRCVIVAVYRQHALDCDSWCICWYDYDRLLLVLVGIIRVSLSKDYINFAAWVARS